jgi:hypothetical protein
MEQSPSRKANSRSDNQEISFYGIRIFIVVLASAPTWTLNHLNPIHTLISCFCKDYFNIILPSSLRPPNVNLINSSSLNNFHQPLATSSLLGPNILLSTLFSNTLNLCSSLWMVDEVSYSYKTAGKIIVSYILILNC